MRTAIVIGAIAAWAIQAALAVPCTRDDTGIPMPQEVKRMEEKYQVGIQAAVKQSASCTEENLLVRRSW